MNCGTNLVDLQCTNCQSPLASGARFCSECGQPTNIQSEADDTRRALLATRAPVELSRRAQISRDLSGERRVVTSVFADVVGSTALAERLDPEDWAAIMNGAFERITASIYKYEGTIARLMGDALLAFFGAPVSHEDDAERAVRAGLDLLAEIRQYAVEMRSIHDIEFQMRVGINTGNVVVGEVGSDLAYEYTAMGDAINLAARMEQSAQPGTVQISEFTYKIVEPIFDVHPLGEIRVKGKRKAVLAYNVLGVKESPGRARGIEGLQSPIIGRDHEVEALTRSVSSTRAGRGQIVCLIGEAGLGKSRLIEELSYEWQSLAQSPEDLIHYRGVSFEIERPYGVFRRSLLDRFGVNENEPQEFVLKAILGSAGLKGADTNTNPKYIAAIRSLLRLAADENGSDQSFQAGASKADLYEGILSPMRHRLQTFPALFIFDDLHWADPASVQLAEQMLSLADEYPAMLLFATRPDRGSPGWHLLQTAERDFPHRYTAIELSRLSPEDSSSLVSNLLNIREMPDQTRRAINEKAEGNPFFIEEILRTLLESGAIVHKNGHSYWRGTADRKPIEIPGNVNALLTARIDQLEPEARRTLQFAAVIGRHFSREVLENISDRPDQVRHQLNDFERHGLVMQVDSGARYSFRHDLTRDAAYSSILRKQRSRLHRRVGEEMEKLFSDQRIEQAPILTYHFDQAGDRKKVLEYAWLAGEEASRVHAVTEAIHFFKLALEASHKLSESLANQAPIYTRLGRSLELASRFEDAYQLYSELDHLAEAQANKQLRLEAILGMATLRVIANTYYNPVEGKQLLEEASVLAEELGDLGGRAKILWQLLLLDVSTGRDDQARLRYGEQGLALARSEGREELSAFILHDLWYAYGGSGQWEKAVEGLEEACDIWRKLGNKPLLSESLLRLSLSYQAQGQDDLAIEYSDEAFANGLQSDNADQKAISRSLIGTVHVERGEWMRALEIMEASIEYGRPVTNVTACVGTRSHLALLYLELGKIQLATALLDEAFEVDFEILKPFAQSALIEVLIYEGQLEEAAQVAALLPSSTEQKRKLGAMTPLWVRIGLAHTKLALAREQWGSATQQAEELIDNLETDGLHWLLAEAIYLKGLALRAEPERLDAAEQVLRSAHEEAQRQGSKRTLWKILAALGDLARLKEDEMKAAAYREEAAGILKFIVDDLADEDLRASFFKTPAVQTIYSSPESPGRRDA